MTQLSARIFIKPTVPFPYKLKHCILWQKHIHPCFKKSISILASVLHMFQSTERYTLKKVIPKSKSSYKKHIYTFFISATKAVKTIYSSLKPNVSTFQLEYFLLLIWNLSPTPVLLANIDRMFYAEGEGLLALLAWYYIVEIASSLKHARGHGSEICWRLHTRRCVAR